MVVIYAMEAWRGFYLLDSYPVCSCPFVFVCENVGVSNPA